MRELLLLALRKGASRLELVEAFRLATGAGAVGQAAREFDRVVGRDPNLPWEVWVGALRSPKKTKPLMWKGAGLPGRSVGYWE